MSKAAPATPDSLQMRPPLMLALGPAGSGKTHWALNRFGDSEGNSLLLVPSLAQAETCIQQIARDNGVGEARIRGRVTTFSGLIGEILRAYGPSTNRSIGRTFQRLILTDLVRTHLRPDDFLGRMREAPGFVPALCERLREWKLAGAIPDTLEQGAYAAADLLQDSAFPRKTAEFVRLFRAYETFLLQNRLQDEEDSLRLAATYLTSATSHNASLLNQTRHLILDGFYRFNRAQRNLLAALAGRGVEIGKPETEVAVTLPYDATRPLLFVASERTLTLLRNEFQTTEIPLFYSDQTRPALLRRLEANLFQKGRERREEGRGKREEREGPAESVVRTESQPLRDERRETGECALSEVKGSVLRNERSSDASSLPSSLFPLPSERASLRIFDAPNAYVEAEMTARVFRRLREEQGYAWSDFAVILRGMGDYAPILAAVFERYAIPLGVDGPEILAENPLLKTVLHLLAVYRFGWRRDDVLAFLKSSYTGPDKVEADGLRRRACAAGVREGRERWLSLLPDSEPVSHHGAGVEGVEQEAISAPVGIAETLRLMAHHERALTADRVAPAVFVERLLEIITAFGLEERIPQGEPARIARDRVALKEGLGHLDALVQMAQMADRNLLNFAQFHEELLAAWQTASALAPTEADMVRVAEPYDARERPLKVAAVMGLTERVFPRRITEDPFLRDEERAALRQVSALDLEAQKGRTDDERFLFYLAVTAPSDTLILSYPRASQEADTLPSFYLDEVKAVFSPPHSPLLVSHTLADVAPRPEDAISESDRLLAACANLFDPGAESDTTERLRRRRQAATLMRSCLEQEGAKGAVQAVVAARRLPRLPVLQTPTLRADFAGTDRVFSVSELETYNRCPFQYLLRHTLRLHPEEEGAHPRLQGTLLHAVLRRYFHRHASRPDVCPPDADTMRTDLRALLTETLHSRPWDMGPHQLRMTERMLGDALDAFAAREQTFGAQFQMRPTHFELAFGFDADGARARDEEERILEAIATEEGASLEAHDPASSPEPLRLQATPDGPIISVCGTIDRVDLDITGRRALALDYKLGRSPDFSEIQRGASLQMPLYLLALERLFDRVGAVGCFDSMRERGRRRFLRTEHATLRHFAPIVSLDDPATVKPLNRDQYADLAKTTESTAVRIALSIREADITATPGDHCRLCPYGDVCRTTLAGGHDGETQRAE